MNFTPFIQLPILRVCGVDFNPFYLPSVYTAALSMPPSSCVMKLSRSPTVCDTGLSVNSQFSRRDGKGTVNTERPSLTSTRASEISGNMYDRLIHPTQQALFNRIILIKVIKKKHWKVNMLGHCIIYMYMYYASNNASQEYHEICYHNIWLWITKNFFLFPIDIYNVRNILECI